MKIDAIDVFHVRMPLIEPWRTAYGEDPNGESVLVRMEADGHVGWGEASPLAAPCYSPEWAGGVFACIREWFAPALVGTSIHSGDDLQERLAHFKGNPFAKAALDTAWWVTEAVNRGQPLHRLLGAVRDAVDVGADFGVMDSIGDLLPAIGRALDEGFPRVKLKFRPGWDTNMLRAVRDEFPTARIHIDCNSAYRIEDLELLARLDDFGLEMIEQPLAYDDLVDHARLQEAIRTPICLDESVTSLEVAQQAIDLGSCRYMNVKPGRVGGLTTAVAIHNACRAEGIPCWVGGMLESAVGARICLALATLDNFTYPADIFPSARFYAEDIATPPLELNGSQDGTPQAVASAAAGIGTEPDEERLKNCCVQHARIEKI